MTPETIVNGWLMLSRSPKAELKRTGWRSPRHGRTPLGDKGLGRLGAQRLAKILRIRTRPRPPEVAVPGLVDVDPDPGAVEQFVQVDFRPLRSTAPLSTIRPLWETRAADRPFPGPRPWGTVVELIGLSESISKWTVSELQDAFAGLVDPFARHGDFDILVQLDGQLVNIE